MISLMSHRTFFLFSFVALSMGMVLASCTGSNTPKVWVEGRQLRSSEGPHAIKGVCYHPVPIGQDKRSFESLTQDLALMQDMGINTIRVYEPIASEAVLDEIHEAGISVIVGIGYNQDGVYDLQSGTYLDYVERFKSHPAILMWELGNEYNFHPEWFGGSLDLWYETLRDASAAIQAADPNHPVSTAHGELPDEELIAAMTDIDLWGLNVYRWDVSYTAAVDFAKRSDKPMYFSEIGADSYMSTTMLGYEQGPNQRAQADATRALLAPLFSDSVPCVGAAIFSFTDGWWKAGQADVQDPGGVAPASSGVPYDADANEEHWGLVDIHRNPKEAYHVVKSLFESNNASGMKDPSFQKTVFETSRHGGRFHEVSQDVLDGWNNPHPTISASASTSMNASRRSKGLADHSPTPRPTSFTN